MLLTRTKTTGPGKTVPFRPVYVEYISYVYRADWLLTGYRLQQEFGDYPRDYLLPTPTANGFGYIAKPLGYVDVAAISHRVMSELVVPSDVIAGDAVPMNTPLLHQELARSYWREHSWRAFLPSAAGPRRGGHPRQLAPRRRLWQHPDLPPEDGPRPEGSQADDCRRRGGRGLGGGESVGGGEGGVGAEGGRGEPDCTAAGLLVVHARTAVVLRGLW